MIVGIIPVRMASTRFPGKPLARINGLTLVEWVYKAAKESSQLNEVYIATCDEEIKSFLEQNGIKVLMTSDKHRGCLERILEASTMVTYDTLVMIQGDEPLITGKNIDDVVIGIKNNIIANAIGEIHTLEEFNNKNVVKVVIDEFGYIMYMSREPIPSYWKNIKPKSWYKQIGLMAFKQDALKYYETLPSTDLELTESIDMNRFLESGYHIKGVPIDYNGHAVDIPEDISIVEGML